MLNRHFHLSQPVLSLPRYAKRLVVMVVDINLCILTVWLSLCLRLGEIVYLSGATLLAAAVSVVCALPVFAAMGVYQAVLRYSGTPNMFVVIRAIGIYGLVYASIFTAISIPGIPRTVGLLQPLLLLLAVSASRALVPYWLGNMRPSELQMATLPRSLIYGAGIAGRQLASALHSSYEMCVVGFLDDDDRLHGGLLDGQPIFRQQIYHI